jgi:hypothetical protein
MTNAIPQRSKTNAYMNKAFTRPCITKDDVKSGRWAVKLELVPSAKCQRKEKDGSESPSDRELYR